MAKFYGDMNMNILSKDELNNESSESLITMLKEKNWRAAYLLGIRKEKTAAVPLLDNLDYGCIEKELPTMVYTMASLYALGLIKDIPDICPIVKVLDIYQCYLKWMAAWALGEIGDPGAIDALRKAGNWDPYGVFWEAGISITEGNEGVLDKKALRFFRFLEDKIYMADNKSAIDLALEKLGSV